MPRPVTFNLVVSGGLVQSFDSQFLLDTDLPRSGVAAGGYTSPSYIQVDQFGRVLAVTGAADTNFAYTDVTNDWTALQQFDPAVTGILWSLPLDTAARSVRWVDTGDSTTYVEVEGKKIPPGFSAKPTLTLRTVQAGVTATTFVMANGVLTLTGNTTVSGALTVDGTEGIVLGSDTVALTINANSGAQTQDLTQWINASGAIAARVSAAGRYSQTDGTHTLALSGTTTVTTSDTEFVAEETGDGIGTSRFRLRNRSGINGVIFQTTGASVVEMQFDPGLTPRTLRLEARNGQTFAPTPPEFQFGNAGFPTFCVADDRCVLYQTNADNFIEFRANDTGAANMVQGEVRSHWANAVDATRKGRVSISCNGFGGSHEGFRVEDTGSAAAIAFFGGTANAQQTVTGKLASATTVADLVSTLQSLMSALATKYDLVVDGTT